MNKPSCRVCKAFRERKNQATPCQRCLPFLAEENRKAIDVFMLSIYGVRYSPMGKPLGVDLKVVIELVKLMKDSNPIDTIERVIFLSERLIRNAD